MAIVPTVLAVSDATTRGDLPWEAWCARIERSGADGLLTRERKATDRQLFEHARLARELFAGTVLAHRRFDIALAAGVDGVHLPSAGLPTGVVRRSIGDQLLIGRSTHRLDEVELARASADYVFFGPVFPTPGKSAGTQAESLERLAAACAVGPPVLAIGGIDAASVDAVVAAGAAGVAAIRAFTDDGAAAELVAAIRAALPRRTSAAGPTA